MAAVTTADVTVLDSYPVETLGRTRGIKRKLQINCTAAGDIANDIAASTLGFRRIDEISSPSLVTSGNIRGVLLNLAPNGTEIVPFAIETATDANRNVRAAITGVLTLWVTGVSNR